MRKREKRELTEPSVFCGRLGLEVGAGGLGYFPIWWFTVSANTFPFASCRKDWEGQDRVLALGGSLLVVTFQESLFHKCQTGR